MKKKILELARELKAYVTIIGRNASLQEKGFSNSWLGLASLADIGMEVLGEQILHGVGTWTSQISNEDLLRLAEKLIEKEGGLSWSYEEKVLQGLSYIKGQIAA